MQKNYPLSKQEFASKMKEKRKILFNKADEQLKQITQDKDKYLEFLFVLSKGFTVTNSLLIQSINPNVTILKDVPRWKEENIFVRKEEKGIPIFEPSHSFTRKDGSTGVNYNIKYLFDISQTTANNYPVAEFNYEELEFALKHKERGADTISKTDLRDDDYLYALLRNAVQDASRHVNDDFLIGSICYALSKRYGIKANEDFIKYYNGYFNQDKVFDKKILNNFKNILDTVMSRIEHGLYFYNHEVNHHE